MTDDPVRLPWLPAMFTEQMQETGEQMLDSQQELFAQWLQASSGAGLDRMPGLGAMNLGTATFKSRVQSGGRISIPDAEREALDIQEGDIVQTIVVPVKRNREEE